MTIPMEIEIKLAASPLMLEKLRAHPQLAGDEQISKLVTTYYDTADLRLRQRGATLRTRDDGRSREQTLKLVSPQGSAVRRREWNGPLVGEIPNLAGFGAKEGSALAKLLGAGPLQPVAMTRIQRTTRRLRFGNSAIEAAFDLGTIHAGGREEAVCELELELIEGQLVDVIALAQQLPLGPELRWSIRGKAERCHALAHDLSPVAVQGLPIRLSPEMDVALGFQTVAWNVLEQLLANYQLVVASADPEGVHQTRVAIRRLRAAFTLFKDIADDEAGAVLQAELRAVAGVLGRVRNLQVLIERVTEAVQAGDDDLQGMLGHLVLERTEAAASAQAMLAAEPFQRLLFDLAAWLEGGAWLDRLGERSGDRPLRLFARHVLSRQRRRLRKLGKRLDELPDADLHRLRKEAKTMRYAVGFFTALFADQATTRARHRFTTALRKLQDSLGEINDLAVAEKDRDALFASQEAITGARYGAQLVVLLAEAEPSRRRLIKIADKSLAKVIKGRAWWQAGER